MIIYSCPKCGSKDVLGSFPVWLDLNDIDNTYGLADRLDFEAEPEKDSNKCWCPECDESVLPAQEESTLPQPAKSPLQEN